MRAMQRMTGLLFALTALTALCAQPAQAQFGGLVKKAAKKAVDAKVQEKVDAATPVAPLAGDPVTGETLDALLRGLSLELDTQGRTKELAAAIDAKSKEVADAERAAGNEPDVWHKASSGVERCVSNSLEKSNELHAQEAPGKLLALSSQASGNAAVVAKIEAVGKRMRDAQAKGDMPAYLRAAADYLKMLGFDLAKDSAAAFGVCGTLPPKPASMVKLERLQAEAGALSDQRRDIEAEGDARAAKAAGMPADKYALARERLWAWSVAHKQKQSQRAITRDENDLFTARASDIKRIESLLR